MQIVIRNPLRLWTEIRKVISAFHRVAELSDIKNTWALRSFMKDYPELYHMYLSLCLESEEVKRGKHHVSDKQTDQSRRD